MKKTKGLLILFLTIAFLFFLTTNVNAGYQKINNLEYEVELKKDGTAMITEIWDIYISETNTLFKTFEYDTKKYDSMGNVYVYEILDDNTEKLLSRTNTYQFHVDKDSYYALINESGQYEIAWGVGLDDSYDTRKYKITYAIENVVKKYSDCSDFYWQFISNKNSISCKNVVGRIYLPREVENIEDLRVWAHGSSNDGIIERRAKDYIYFETSNLQPNTMVEVRTTVLDEKVFSDISNVQNVQKLDEILKEEANLANKANIIRNRKKILHYGYMVAIVLIFIILILKMKKYKEKIKSNYGRSEQKWEYFREIPDEDATVAEASFLYYFSESGFQRNLPKIISATIMNFNLKNIIEFEKDAEDSKNQKIILKEKINLSKEEELVYDMLEKSSKYNDGKIYTSTKMLEKYISDRSATMGKKFLKIFEYTKENELKKGNITRETEKEKNKFIFTFIWYITLIFFAVGGTCINLITLILFPVLIIDAKLINDLSQRCISSKGAEEKEKWNGLYNYMKDFSLLKEKEIPDIILWEKFLVFATAFGIAEKVIEQLKIVYPNLAEDDYINNMHNYYFIHNSFEQNIEKTITNSIADYNTERYASSSGSGGGFSSSSSGGGGGAGGGSMGGR